VSATLFARLSNRSEGRSHVVCSDLGHVVSILQAFLVGLRDIAVITRLYTGL